MGRRRTFVVGAGGLGREVAALLMDLEAHGGELTFAGFVDPDPQAKRPGQDVLGDDDWLLAPERGSAAAVLGIGFGHARLRVANRLEKADHLDFPSLVHPSSHVQPSVRSGPGNVIAAGVVVSCDTDLGEFNHLNWNVTVGHDVRLGRGCVVNPGAAVSGDVILGDGVLVGAHACILQGRRVGQGATIGAGAVVTDDVEPGATVVGVPARPIPGSS